MLSFDAKLVLLFGIININTFLIGFLLGKSLKGLTNESNTQSFFKQQQAEQKIKNQITIDDKKVVLNIDTNKLEKKYDSLGETKTSSEDISGAVNKLKNMKN